jgi:Domain of unknown function (DUF892)
LDSLIEEGKDTVSEDAGPSIKDAALIAAAQRVEHYEMAGDRLSETDRVAMMTLGTSFAFVFNGRFE